MTMFSKEWAERKAKLEAEADCDVSIGDPTTATSFSQLGKILEGCNTLQDMIKAIAAQPDGCVMVGPLKVTPEMAEAVLKPMTPEQAEEQRRSFAFGNTAIENPLITREMIDKAAEDIADD